ncbi:ZFP36L1 [Symbiodinium sp. CCMP2592]|nr:ZFP36L1 [Symbiodinium sp. CCMP2592]
MSLSVSRPYRRVHQLTWTHLNRARWPENGSLAWHPTWGFQKPLLPTSLSAPRAVTPPLTAAPPLHWEPGPQRLKKRLQDALGLSAQDALALVQRHCRPRKLPSMLCKTISTALSVQNGRPWAKRHASRWMVRSRAKIAGSRTGTRSLSMAIRSRRSAESPLWRTNLQAFRATCVWSHAPSPAFAAGFALSEGDPLKRPTYVQLLLPGWTSRSCRNMISWASARPSDPSATLRL